MEILQINHIDSSQTVQESAKSTENELLWKRNLHILWFAQLIAMIGMSACIPFLPLYIRELGITDSAEAQRWSGMIHAAPFFLAVIATPIWGMLSDRYSKKFMVVRAVLGLGLAMFLMGFAQNVWQLFFLRLLQGIISGFIASTLGLVSATTPEKHLGYAISFLQTSVSCGAMIGPMVGGIFADAFGVRQVFFIVAGLCCTSAVIVMLFVKEIKQIKKTGEKNGVWKNIKFIMSNRDMKYIFMFITTAQAGVILTFPILIFYLETLHTPSQYLGTITGIMVGSVGLITTIFGPFWGKRSDLYGAEKIMRIALPFLSLAFFLHTLASSYLQLIPLRIMMGIFTGATVPILYGALSKICPKEMRGGIMGLASSATILGNLIGPVICSYTSYHLGIQWNFVISGCLILLVYVLILTKKPTKSTCFEV